MFLSRSSVELRRPLIPSRASGVRVAGHYCAYTIAIGAVFACLGRIPSTTPVDTLRYAAAINDALPHRRHDRNLFRQRTRPKRGCPRSWTLRYSGSFLQPQTVFVVIKYFIIRCHVFFSSHRGCVENSHVIALLSIVLNYILIFFFFYRNIAILLYYGVEINTRKRVL